MVTAAIIGVLAAIAIPNFIKARADTQRNSCINNMKQIDSAKQMWALDNNKISADTPTSADLSDYIRGGFPDCPTAGSYAIRNVAGVPPHAARMAPSGELDILPIVWYTYAVQAEGHKGARVKNGR